MADDPVTWLTKEKRAGIDLREECWNLRTTEEADAWHKRELLWAKELSQGINARSERDVERIEVLNKIPVCPLPQKHPWHGKHLNPLDFLARRLDEVEKIESEWRGAAPLKLKFKKATGIDFKPFLTWFSEYAAKSDQCIDRDKTKNDADNHFQRSIPWDWIKRAHQGLPPDHPAKRKGRPPAT